MSEEKEYTGGSVSYYSIDVNDPINENSDPYTAECQDIIEALKLDFQEGNVLKAIWRRAAARLGRSKKGYDDGLYDAEKIVFYGQRLVAAEQRAKRQAALPKGDVYAEGARILLTAKANSHRGGDETYRPSDADGWYAWNGLIGSRPAGNVEVEFRNGSTITDAAEDLSWMHCKNPDDIVKWRPARAAGFDPYGPRDAEGWYAWSGDETMRPAGKVDVVKRDGEMWCGIAEGFIWNYGGSKSPADIVKWRPFEDCANANKGCVRSKLPNSPYCDQCEPDL